MKGKRRWLGLRVWVADADGNKHNGTLWFENDTDVLIRKNGRPGLVGFPKAAEGTGWGFVDGAPSAADPPVAAAKAKATTLRRVPLRHKQMRRLMHEWDTASLLPAPLLALLSSLFPGGLPAPEPARLHL